MEGHWLCEYEDETSQFDPEGYWCYGTECFMRKYSVWIPNTINPDDDESVKAFIEATTN